MENKTAKKAKKQAKKGILSVVFSRTALIFLLLLIQLLMMLGIATFLKDFMYTGCSM